MLIAEGTLGKALEYPVRTFEGLSGDVHCFNDFPGDQSTRVLLPIRWIAGGQAFPGHSIVPALGQVSSEVPWGREAGARPCRRPR